jgi:two-component system, NarL family, nitrate/nitrite response regulator NarL
VVVALSNGGVSVVRRVRAQLETARMIVLGTPEDDDQIVALAEAGASGFVERSAHVTEVVHGLEALIGGDAFCPPRIASALLRRVTSAASAETAISELPELTMREREIVDLIAQGLSNKEIALRLYIEVSTVKNHVHNILEKLRVTRRGEAAERLLGSRQLVRT